MAAPYDTLFLFLSFTTLVSLSLTITAPNTTTITATATATATAIPKRLVTKIIHRNSVLSPYYNPNVTILDRAKRAMKSSMARFAYLQAKTRRSSVATNDVRADIIAEESGTQFLANISIGEPPVPQLLAIDTGSNLLWVQCLPCTKCFEQSSPIFDPSKSSTYANLSCDSPSCIFSPKGNCDSFNHCNFSLGYIDGTTTEGNVATEKLTFVTSDEGISTIFDAVFGCGHNNDGFNGQPSGILGLGPENISLPSQLGSKFSYCIGNISDPHYIYNQLIIGDGTKIEGFSTPMELFNGLYYLTLEGINVGDKLLDIDPEIFKRTPSGTGGVVIDTGTTVTFLVEKGFNQLSLEVQRLADGLLKRVLDPDNPSRLCYKGIASRDLTGFPVVTFHFAGGADLVLDKGSLFEENGPDEFCMAVTESALNDLTIIGIMAQQYYNVGYDLDSNKISFERIDCELLES